MSKILNCSICGNEIGTDTNGWSEGNNAEPISDGRCCHLCDCMIVIPIRLMPQAGNDLGNGEAIKEFYKQTALLGIRFLVQRMETQQNQLKTP